MYNRLTTIVVKSLSQLKRNRKTPIRNENKTNFLKVELIRVTVRVKVKTTKGTFCNLEELYTQILSGKLRYTQI